MINNKRSYTEYNITSPTTDFAIGFENYGVGAKDIIEVTLNGALVESLGYTVRLKNAQVLEVTPAIEAGTVRLQRVTGIDSPFHKFTAGALFSAKSMDENFQQVRHSQQEVRDGFVFLEYNTNGIVQASKEATAQAKAATVTATASAVRAETAADTAVQAVGSLQGVVDSATTATTNANNATATATTAASQATAAVAAAQNATSAATLAKQEATTAAANAKAATVGTLAATGRANEAADVVTGLTTTVNARVAAVEVSQEATIQRVDNFIATDVVPIVNDAINNTAVEGGVLADTFVVVDGSLSQRTINKGLESIADLSTIKNPKDGLRVYVKSYHAGLGKGDGYFTYDSSKAAINDGGVVVNGWVRQFVGMVQPEWWGAIPDGVTPCTTSMRAAIKYCKDNPARDYHPASGGSHGVWLSRGVYAIDGQLDVKKMAGFTFACDSTRSAVLLYTLNTGYLFDMQAYHFIGFKAVSIMCGITDVATTGRRITRYGQKGATAFNLKGQDGGRFLWLDELEIEGFGTVFRSKDDQINVDKTSVYRCNITYCDIIWDNYNYNAVSWTFRECSFSGYKIAFNNPSNNLRVLDGLSQGGTFWKGDTLSNVLNRGMTFRDIRFETYVQTDTSNVPMWLDITGRSKGVVFENCSMYAEVPNLSEMVTGRMNATDYQDVKFVNCELHGIFELISGKTIQGVTPRLTLENCPVSPTFNMRYTPNSGNKHMNLILRDFWTSELTRVNRYFLSQRDTGAVSEAGKSLANANDKMIDTYSTLAIITGAMTTTNTFKVFTVAPFSLLLAEITISYNRASTSPVTFNFYTDSTKGTLIATKEVTKKVGVTRITADDMLDTAEFSSTSAPLYMEMVTTTGFGLMTSDISFEYVVKSTEH